MKVIDEFTSMVAMVNVDNAIEATMKKKGIDLDKVNKDEFVSSHFPKVEELAAHRDSLVAWYKSTLEDQAERLHDCALEIGDTLDKMNDRGFSKVTGDMEKIVDKIVVLYMKMQDEIKSSLKK